MNRKLEQISELYLHAFTDRYAVVMITGAGTASECRRSPGTRRLPFAAYVVGFHLIWAMWPYYGYPRLLALGDGTLTYAIANLMIRFLVWVAPVWIYLRRLDHVDPIEYLELRGHLGRGLLVALVLTVVNFLGTVARLGPPHPSLQSVTWNSMLGTSVLIGFIEEVPYRGFMLQKLTEDFGFWPAALGTSLLFVAVHIPGWIALHMLTVDRAVSIFVFGAVMALAFRYARSLWAPILAHSTNDFMSFVLFHV